MRFRPLILGAASVALFMTSDPAQGWSPGQAQTAAQVHPVILAAGGGEYDDDALTAYVTAIGVRLTAETERAQDAWSFTILDNAEIDAFAVAGGNVYVTRGLLAQAGSEAQLAAALALQISHLVMEHGGRRVTAGMDDPGGLPATVLMSGAAPESAKAAAGDLRLAARFRSGYTEAEVAAADAASVRLLEEAGFPPEARIRLVQALAAQEMLAAELGAEGAPTSVRYFDTQAGLRELLAGQRARRPGAEEIAGTERYLSAIAGLVYGDNPHQGYSRGRTYIHPELLFAFDAPESFAVESTALEVIATGPGGARILLDAVSGPISRLDSYIRDRWAPSLMRRVEAGYLYDLRTLEIGGMPAAVAFQPFEDETGPKVMQLAVIRYGERVFRFRAIAPAEDIEASLAMEEAVASFRALELQDVVQSRAFLLWPYQVRPGDTINMINASMPMRSDPERRFRVLNGMGERDVLMVGAWVKLVVEP